MCVLNCIISILKHLNQLYTKIGDFSPVLDILHTAEKDDVDENGHDVSNGEFFLKCHYLNHTAEKRDCHYYKEDTKTTYVSPKTILSPFVNMSKELTLSLQDYQFICDEIK